jgi:hypothetical protein
MFCSSPWLAKFFVELLVAHELANIGKKSELDSPKRQACQIKFWPMMKKLAG